MRNDKRSFILVQISEGRNLAIKDIVSSDPYIRIAIVPKGCKKMPPKSLKSTYINESLNPVWNFSRLL